MQRIGTLIATTFLAAGCAAGTPPEKRAEFKGEQLNPNEEYHAVKPCAEHVLAPARVSLEVLIDAEGKPREAFVTPLGGTVRDAFASCVHTRLLAQTYTPRGKPMTIGKVVDLHVGAYSSAGSPTPFPPSY